MGQGTKRAFDTRSQQNHSRLWCVLRCSSRCFWWCARLFLCVLGTTTTHSYKYKRTLKLLAVRRSSCLVLSDSSLTTLHSVGNKCLSLHEHTGSPETYNAKYTDCPPISTCGTEVYARGPGWPTGKYYNDGGNKVQHGYLCHGQKCELQIQQCVHLPEMDRADGSKTRVWMK